jgi:tRNA dimethylallyltransferase
MNSTSNSGALVKRIIPALVGPTCVGKTATALELVEKFNLEIVSCDSRQIYKFLNIGTAKPTAEELQGKPYHLIDYVDPEALYSAELYRRDAVDLIAGIFLRGKTPLLVGGAGLYLQALATGFFATPDPDLGYREELQKSSTEELYRKLAEDDPETAEALADRNRTRLIRALEILHLTGQSKEELSISGDYPKHDFEVRPILLSYSREKLYQIINSRVDKMIEAGLFDEVDSLLERGYAQSPVLRSTLGYREPLALRNGKVSRDQCVEKIKQGHRNYAKRQLTWFRKIENLLSIEKESTSWKEKLRDVINKFNLDSQIC